MNINNKTEMATLANGCFWCTEAIFKRVKGVKSIIPGYAGGTVKNPPYDGNIVATVASVKLRIGKLYKTRNPHNSFAYHRWAN
jgi:peptide methionine sulfoxide reductase MsrA